MAKKGKGAGKKKQAKEDKDVLPEVDKEFYEIQITDLNQKLARLRSRCTDLELENEDVRKNLQKLDDDRADIIAYLKRTLQAKADEISELQERLVALQQTREAEKTMFLEKIKVMEHDFKSMHEQLNSEIKLLNGKLNSLEEFRREREELMNKYIKQEEEMEEQEKRHKIALYEIERKFIVGKDELKNDMENKLLQLSLDFQNTTDIRIATTTHRVIRENIAINNDINILMESWKNLHDENVDLKKKGKELKLELELHKDDAQMLLNKNLVQKKIIEKVTAAHSMMKEAYGELSSIKAQNKDLELRVDALMEELSDANCERQKLVSVLEIKEMSECEHEAELVELRDQCLVLQQILTVATSTVSEALHDQEQPDDVESKREVLPVLSTLLQLFDNIPTKKPSVTTKDTSVAMKTTSTTYGTGDMGLKSKSSLSTPVTKRDSVSSVNTRKELTTLESKTSSLQK